MRSVRLLLSLLLLLTASPLVRAQWSGSVSSAGGFGFAKSLRGELWPDDLPKYLYHGLGQVSAQVNYASPTFRWMSMVQGNVEKKQTDNYRMSVQVLNVGNEEEFDYDIKNTVRMTNDSPVNVSYRTEFSWLPSPGRQYTLWGKYNYYYIFSDNFSSVSSEKTQGELHTIEDPLVSEHTVGAGFRASRQLGSSRRLLAGECSFDLDDRDMTTYYTTIEFADVHEDDMWVGIYRLSPHSRVTTINGLLHVRDSVLTGTSRLTIDPGVRFTSILGLHQNSGATMDEEGDYNDQSNWRDSTRLREWFHFTSLETQPYLAADFSWKKLRIHADYALMFYARRLTDSTHRQGFRWQRPYVVGNSSIEWRFSPRHLVTLSQNFSVSHPDYLQVCWFDRSGGYIDQLYRGSEKLRSTRTDQYRMAYDFNYKRFVANVSVAYTHRLDEIEQTWFSEEIDGRTYTIFTWLNGGDTKIFSASHRIGWRGKVLTANAGVVYNQAARRLHDSETVKKSNDWCATADVAARLPKGWTLATDVRYQSDVSTFFALFKEYCVLNARVQKEFKHITLSLEGRDLLDKALEATVISEDETEGWWEKTVYNRRLIVLGLTWKF